MTELSCGNIAVQLSTTRGHRLRATAPVGLEAFQPAWGPAVPRPAGMIGRRSTLAQLAAAISPGRPVMVHGRSGVGVSTLLQQVAAGAAGVDPQREPVFLLDALGRTAADLLRELVALAFPSNSSSTSRTVVPTPSQCRELLGGLAAVVVLDHVSLAPAWLDAVLPALAGCRVVLGGSGPVRPAPPASHPVVLNLGLPGLGEQDCVELIANELPVRLDRDQERAARMLAEAVDGVPRRVRQAAALVRVGAHTLPELATRLAMDPAVLDQLSLAALPRSARRVVAGLAGLGGLAVPVEVVRTVTEVGEAESMLRLLRGRGLVEPRVTSAGAAAGATRYAVPARLADRYAELLAGYTDPGAAAHAMISYLVGLRGGAAALDAAPAAATLLQAAADRGDDACVVTLAGLVEPALLVRGDWAGSAAALDLGIAAARRRGDDATLAYLANQRGALAAVAQEPDLAAQAFTLALELRRRLGDQLGEARTVVGLTELASRTAGGVARAVAAGPPPAAKAPARRGLPRQGQARRLPVVAGWSAALVVAGVALSGFADPAGGGEPQALGLGQGLGLSQVGAGPVALPFAAAAAQRAPAAVEQVTDAATAQARPVPGAATAEPVPAQPLPSPTAADLVPAGVEVAAQADAGGTAAGVRRHTVQKSARRAVQAAGSASRLSVAGVSLDSLTRLGGDVLGLVRHTVDLVTAWLR